MQFPNGLRWATNCAGDIDEWSRGQSFILKLLLSIYVAVHTDLYSGLLCTEFLFAKQRAALSNAGRIGDTRQHDSINAMAQLALDQCTGALLPVGLSMGGYVALEMARLALRE